MQMEQQLYAAVSATSSWLDQVENTLFSGSVLLAENAETQLLNQEVRGLIVETQTDGNREKIHDLTFTFSHLADTLIRSDLK